MSGRRWLFFFKSGTPATRRVIRPFVLEIIKVWKELGVTRTTWENNPFFLFQMQMKINFGLSLWSQWPAVTPAPNRSRCVWNPSIYADLGAMHESVVFLLSTSTFCRVFSDTSTSLVDQLSIIFDADVRMFIFLLLLLWRQEEEYRCVTVEHVVLHLAPFLFAFGSRSPEFYDI